MKRLIRTAEAIGKWKLYRNGGESKWFDTSVGQVHTFHMPGQGTLPPVVLLHGLGSSALSYAPLAKSLLPHVRTVIAVDMPAHGFSHLPKQAISPITFFQGIQETLDTLEHEPFHLVGNSLGGGMAIRYTLHNPARVRSLFLMSPAGSPTLPEEREDFLSLFAMEHRQDAERFMERLLYKTPWYRPLVVSFIHTNFRRPMLKQFLNSVNDPIVEAEYTFKPKELQSLKPPICLVWGKGDRIMPPSHFPFYKKHFPEGTEFHQLEEVGHSPQIEKPQVIAQIMLAFWNRIPH